MYVGSLFKTQNGQYVVVQLCLFGALLGVFTVEVCICGDHYGANN